MSERDLTKMKMEEIQADFHDIEFNVSNYIENLEKMNSLIRRTSDLIEQKEIKEEELEQTLEKMQEEDAPEAEILQARENLLTCRSDLAELKQLQTGLVVECRRKAQNLIDFKSKTEEQIATLVNEKIDFDEII